MFVTSQHQDSWRLHQHQAVSNRLVAAGLKRGRSSSRSYPFQEQEEGEAEEEWEDRWAPKIIPGDGEWQIDEVADRWRQYPRKIPMGAEVAEASLRLNKNVGMSLPPYPSDLYDFYDDKVRQDIRLGRKLASWMEQVAVICFPILCSLIVSARVVLFASLRRSVVREWLLLERVS